MKTATVQRTALAIVASLLLTITIAGCSHIGRVHFYSIPGESMQPTLYEGDKIIVDEGYYSKHAIQDGDVVVFRHGENVIAKRVLASAGESIEGRHGTVIRNGHTLQESYIAPSAGDEPPELATFGPRHVGPDEIFVIGDNRGASLDSRVAEFGHVYMHDVVGRVVFVYASSHPTTGRAL